MEQQADGGADYGGQPDPTRSTASPKFADIPERIEVTGITLRGHRLTSMRRPLALALALVLTACDGGAPEVPSDASAVVGAWGLVRSETVVDVTSPVAQTLTDYSAVTDARVTVTGTALPPLNLRRTVGGPGTTFWAAFASPETATPSAHFDLSVTDSAVTATLSVYDPSLGSGDDAFRLYSAQHPRAAVTRSGTRYTLSPVQLDGHDGSTITVDASLAFDARSVGAGETVSFVQGACEGEGVRGNRLLLYRFEADGTYSVHRNDRSGWWPCPSLYLPPEGDRAWTYAAGELRFEDGWTVQVRRGGGHLYLDDVLQRCTTAACLQYGDWNYGWETAPTSILRRNTTTFADDR